MPEMNVLEIISQIKSKKGPHQHQIYSLWKDQAQDLFLSVCFARSRLKGSKGYYVKIHI